MPQKLLWIERRFTFDLPISMFPNVLERLRGTPARVADRIHIGVATLCDAHGENLLEPLLAREGYAGYRAKTNLGLGRRPAAATV